MEVFEILCRVNREEEEDLCDHNNALELHKLGYQR